MPATTEQAVPDKAVKKRIILCCDGTWFDSDDGFNKATIKGQATLQVASNVTRISRCFKRRCSDGTLQIINYESGVGTGSNTIDTLTGGAFGLGLTQRVREAYAFLCANYMDGDEIILLGWSRGAFTVRSVAGIIGNLGLLTRQGMESFVPVFKDMQHWKDARYQDPFPQTPFADKPKGDDAADVYRQRLEKMGLTRVTQANGALIKVKAIGVWDTVGSLGIPRIGWLDKLGFRWHDTDLSDRIEHAFQALALDENRSPYSPAVWERRPENKLTTDLRQVWFPGTHGNCGGGVEDVGMANITLAWMMDQMASVGVEFYAPSALRMIDLQRSQYEAKAAQVAASTRRAAAAPWAVDAIFRANAPMRPWALGALQKSSSIVDWITGRTGRTPGQYRQVDPRSGDDRGGPFLLDTNERVHSSARVRLACRGLGLNDDGVWTAPTLARCWQLRRTTARFEDPVPRDPLWDPVHHEAVAAEGGVRGEDGGPAGRRPNEEHGERWVWEYVGPEEDAPTDKRQRVLVEEPLGPYERFLLNQVGGTPNIYVFAEEMGNGSVGNVGGREQDSETETDMPSAK
ncbi:peptidoglycan binding domain containing protein [Cordyceps militaris CM01]|uniref:Peptidoglycan binding domain containing protein n=1 Tax=Cordyceps militaris (strain CM01) TaxID=983644 RepID=G3J587_CORMM|nr:peptidoglycan binding domain containing protein [Cordyceps militaris CM01]EGX96797.1 peptidoglycan binding domain containing protein [Cordyceps militaris CM01]